MRPIAFIALILAAGIGASAAQTAPSLPGSVAQSAIPQQRLTPGQAWVVQQESIAFASPYRLSVISAQLAQERQNRAIRQLAPGRPQRQLR